MATSVFVDTVHYDFVGLHDNTQTDDEQMVTFHHRADIETFVEKAIEADSAELHQLAGDPTISPFDTAALLEIISTQIENGALRVQQNANPSLGGGSGIGNGAGSGGGASSSNLSSSIASNMAASAAGTPQSAPVDQELLNSISDRYSPDMKHFIATNKPSYEQFGGIKSTFLTQGETASNPAAATQKAATSIGAAGLANNANASTDTSNGTPNSSNALSDNSLSAPTNSSATQALPGSPSSLPATASSITPTSSSTPSQTPLPPNTQQELRYKIVVEIAGHHPCAKQLIEISALSTDKSAPREQQAQQNRGVNHNRDNHRGIVEFKKLPNTPRDLAIVIPTSGYGANIRLPLNTTVAPNDNQTEKAEWDNVLVPVKPLAYVTKANQKQQADVLKPGWIYLFWRGKLWRELEVKKNQALRDVNVEYYRRNWNGDFGQEAEREAEGHWQTAVWVPYKLNGEIQSGNNAPLMMYSESQLDWPYVESLEADNAKLLEAASELNLTNYSQDKHFKNADGDMGSIEDALLDQYFDPEEHEYQVVSEKGKDLRGYRDTLVPVVYLQPQGDFFMLEVQDEDGRAVRDKTFALVIGDKEFAGQLDTKGQLKFVVPEGIPGGNGNVKIWAEGDDSEPEIIPFKVNAESLADVSTIEGVQARCNNLGFDAGVVDGINGKKTKNAVKGFQSTYDLDVDGIAGPKTQKKMKKVYKR
mgnify:CR=1 FL=1